MVQAYGKQVQRSEIRALLAMSLGVVEARIFDDISFRDLRRQDDLSRAMSVVDLRRAVEDLIGQEISVDVFALHSLEDFYACLQANGIIVVGERKIRGA